MSFDGISGDDLELSPRWRWAYNAASFESDTALKILKNPVITLKKKDKLA